MAESDLKLAHRIGGCLLGIFLLLHIGNHLAALGGVATHITVMNALRSIYRQPVVEVLLLALLAAQMLIGLRLLHLRWGRISGPAGWLQVISGAYLVFFIVVHVSAVLAGRTIYDLDTNFYFAAAGEHVPWLPLFFVPYYFFAVLALFTHIGCALFWHLSPQLNLGVLITFMLAGLVAAALITGTLTGTLIPITIPPAYLAPYQFLL